MSMAFFRAGVEKAADFALCTILMKRDGKTGPRDAQGNETCLPDYAKKVAGNEGFVQWAPNARPLKCKTCFGRPFTDPERHVSQPNLRRFTVFGRLAFVSVTGPNRSITYPYQVHFTCAAPNGARQGNLAIDIAFDRAIVGEPGFWENLVSFFTADELSRFIDSRIKRELSPIGSLRTFQGPCRSVGIDLGNVPITDAVKFDPPLPTRPFFVATSVDTATIQLLSLRRNPLPPGVAAAHARPGAPEAGQFRLFTNGVVRQLPPAGLALPPEGGSVPLNLCRSVTLGSANRLQLQFVNDLGGAVWSEFPRPAQFGAGPTRTMTTGRTILVPAIGGGPSARPQPVPLREFELTYRISFSPTIKARRGLAGAAPADGGACVAL
ncbi:MAG: hypothetical protein DCF31_02310 [Alphaproteobacteria bacterium]|nr:MAG: hypothetical protein DCF31_02310 [Alphaproteobacteria bacterium]